MNALFLEVSPHRSGYVATSRAPEVIAIGATAVAAAENALLAVRATVGGAKLPPTLIVRNHTRERSTLVLQAINAPIRLEPPNAI